MKAEISNGELLDKITILEIKLSEIKDPKKLTNIQKEFDELNPLCNELFRIYGSELQVHYLALAEINEKLWDIEDWIRDCEREKRFDKEFVELARSVYIINDKRYEVKKLINILTSSGLIEEKLYKEH